MPVIGETKGEQMMHKSWIPMVLGLGMAATAVAAPFDAADVAGEAKWVAHLDADDFRSTQVGQHVLNELNTTEQVANRLNALQAILNFDPRTDLSSITLYGTDHGHEKASAILRGAIDGDHLVILVKADANYASFEHRTHKVHIWTHKHGLESGGSAASSRIHGCLYSDDTLVVGHSADAIKLALDVLDGQSSDLASTAALGDLTPFSQATFFVAAARPSDIAGLDPRAAVFREASSVVASLAETGGTLQARVAMDMGNAETAAGIQAIAQGMISLFTLDAQQKADTDAAALLGDTQVTLSGSEVHLGLAVPAATVIGLIDKEKHKLDR